MSTATDEREPSGPPPTLPQPPKRRAHRRTRAAEPADGEPSGAPSGVADESDSEAEREEAAPAPEREAAPRHRARERAPSGQVARAAGAVSRWPTPGGLAVLVLVLLIFLLLIVPVNGKRTRAKLLWDAIINAVRLPGVAYPDNNGIGFVDPAAAAAAAAANQTQASAAAASRAQAAQATSYAAQGAAAGTGRPALSGGDFGAAAEMGFDMGDELADFGDGFNDVAAFAAGAGRNGASLDAYE